ncbi:MAG: PAS domain-containing protein [candidate division Zixibacteria bacterium]|nr:PAS domain-containing protein [candidate division Zixibacteria bacterium]
MADPNGYTDAGGLAAETDVTQFAESYASFNRIVNSLQRQYLELKEEFSTLNQTLAESNRRLIEMTEHNLVANEFMRSILSSLSAAVIAVDRNGIITHFNPAASVIFGIPVSEPMGRPYHQVIPTGEPLEANAVRAFETGMTVDAVEKRLTLDDGTRLHLSVSTEILRDKDRTPIGAVEVCHDITKIKKLEQEIARLNTLAALGEMAATIAHEVRNPLAGIGGFAVLLQRDLAPADPCQKLVAKIVRGVETLNGIVTTLLNYTRTEELNREDILYDRFLGSVCDLFRQENGVRVAGMEIEFVPSVRATPLEMIVSLDPGLFRQVITNILSNAVDACGGRGGISVQCTRLLRQRATRQYGDKLMLGLDETVIETVISDTGPGIDPASIGRVFAPFFTTKNGGTGLGLAMAWKIVKAHGGEILASNNPDRGARFTVLLPVKIDAATRTDAVREWRTGRVVDEV